MSKKQYIDTFSNIHPSDESIERIMRMTNKKNTVFFRKTVIIVSAVIFILCSFAFAVNAATDGTVAKSVSEAIETVSDKISVLVNSKQINADIADITGNINENSEKCYEVKISSDETESSFVVQYECASDLFGSGALVVNENGKIARLEMTGKAEK